MDIAKFYEDVNASTVKIQSEKSQGLRPWDPDGDCVWIVSTEAHADDGGRAGVAVQAQIKRAAERVFALGRPFRFAVAKDAEPGGAIFENLRRQREQLAFRNLKIAENGDGNMVNTRRVAVKMPAHLQEQS
jgi:hypothetical protein